MTAGRRGAFSASAALLLLLVSTVPSGSAPQVVATDGMATIYLLGDFNRDFDLAYDVTLDPAPDNRSWSLIDVMLVAETIPGDSVEVGVFHGGAIPGAFTSTVIAGTNAFVDQGACANPCRIELRGEATTIVALTGGREAARWARSTFHFTRPSVQLNGEVDAPGDRLAARMHLVHARLAGAALASPTCAFTTRGIEARSSAADALSFSGTHDAQARVAYFALADGREQTICR
jgi:hypothetical protein